MRRVPEDVAGAGGIVASGRLAGEYVGSGEWLTAAQLYARPNVTGYWHSMSRAIPEPACGFMLVQLCPTQGLGSASPDVLTASGAFFLT